MSLYKRTDSQYWWYEFMVRGHRYRGSTEETKKTAARKVEDQERARVKEYRVSDIRPASLSEVFAAYWQQRLKPKGKPRSLQKDESLIRELVNYFGDVPVTEITTQSVNAYAASLFERGLQASTVNRKLAALRAALNFARTNLDALATLPRINMTKAPPYQERYLTDAEVQRLVDNAPDHLARLTLFLADTGARKSEATGLTWDCVTSSFLIRLF